MIVFGIDPGSVNCGWGAIKYEKNKFTLLEYGIVKLKKMEDDFPKRIDILFRKLSSKIHEYKADIVCIETVFNAKNTQSLIKLTHARAAAMLAGTTNNAEISELSPNEVKKSVTGRGHASKEQVQFMVKTLLNIQETPELFDATDALAVALSYCIRSGKTKGKSKNWSEYIKDNPDKVISK
jgi:crossover junction endodeoxyribonuclease RuvC